MASGRRDQEEPLAKRVRAWRKENEVSQSEFTELMRRATGNPTDPTPGYMAQVERGETHPSPEGLEVFAAALGLEVDALAEYRIERLIAALDYREDFRSAVRLLEAIEDGLSPLAARRLRSVKPQSRRARLFQARRRRD